LYLLGGLAFGAGGILPVTFSEEFIEIGAEIGVILLLFMLGLEYTGEELRTNLQAGLPAGLVDLALNFTPGLIAGLLLGWGWLAALLLGGVTYISSSGVIAKLLNDLNRLGNRETPVILAVLVLEDLTMAVFLPLLGVLLVGNGFIAGLLSLVAAVATVVVVLVLAMRYGEVMSRIIANHSDEVVLLTTFGLVLLVAGVAQQLQVSAAVGAFLMGIALSGEVAEQARTLLTPLRDLFAATFFLFFGLQIDPTGIPPVLLLAAGLGLVTALTKVATGWWAARRIGVATRGRFRAGFALVARGEFSIVIAGLGVSANLEPQLGPLAAAYVLFLAILGPVLARFGDPVVIALQRRWALFTVNSRRNEVKND
jgi:CPA2 family monovalent cation:H+ antiporter-2